MFSKIGYLGELKIISFNIKLTNEFLNKNNLPKIKDIKEIKLNYISSVGVVINLDLKFIGLELSKKSEPISVIFISRKNDKYFFADTKNLIWEIIIKNRIKLS